MARAPGGGRGWEWRSEASQNQPFNASAAQIEMKLPVVTMILLLLVLPGFGQEDEKKEAEGKGEIQAMLLRDSTIEPAAGRLTAWFETRSLPIWRNAAGVAPRWEEMGPRVLRNGWGGMDNAG